MKKCFVILLVMGCMLGFLYAPDTHASLITNGGFETGDLTGWTATVPPGGNLAFQVGVYGTLGRPVGCVGPGCWFTVSPYEGNFMAELKGDKDASLSQTFNLSSAGVHNISFAYNLFAYDFTNFGEEGPDYFIVLDNTSVLLSSSLDDTVGLPVTTTGWQLFSGNYNLAAGPHTLQFYLENNPTAAGGPPPQGVANPSLWAYIDSVSVPEPSSILLLGAGLMGIGILRSRFRN